MQVAEGGGEACSDELRLCLIEEPPMDAQEGEEVAADGRLHAQVRLVLVARRAVEAHDEGVMELRDDLLLGARLRVCEGDVRRDLEGATEQRARRGRVVRRRRRVPRRA